MSLKISLTAISFCLLAQTSVFAASDIDKSNYVSIAGGAGWASDIVRTLNAGELKRTFNVEFGNTYGLNMAYGRHINSWLRVEGELGYINSSVDEVTSKANQDMKESGNEKFYSAMINGIVGYNNETKFTPYIGAGLGVVYAKHDVDFDPISTDASPGIDSSESDTVFGYQLLAGIGWSLSEEISLDAKYSFFNVAEREHSASYFPTGTVDIDAMSIHLVMLGLRYNF